MLGKYVCCVSLLCQFTQTLYITVMWAELRLPRGLKEDESIEYNLLVNV